MDFHWLPVRQRSLNSTCNLIGIHYYKTALQYLCDLIVRHSNARELRSNNKRLIKDIGFQF